MIKIMLVVLVLLGYVNNTWAVDKVIKTCETDIKLDSDSVNTKIVITSVDGKLEAKVTQNGNSYIDSVVVEEGTVNSELSADVDAYDNDLNKLELLVVHAMALTEDPIFEGTMSAGMDLKNIKSAKLYIVGKETKFGSSTIVEAKDANGKDLGSFLGGFLVGACK